MKAINYSALGKKLILHPLFIVIPNFLVNIFVLVLLYILPILLGYPLQ